jgi:hypothetical protein
MRGRGPNAHLVDVLGWPAVRGVMTTTRIGGERWVVPRQARRARTLVSIEAAAAALERSGILFLMQVQTRHRRRSARVRTRRVLPGELLVQTTAEPGRALSVHRRDGALDPGGVRVREGGERPAAATVACARSVAASIGFGAVFRIGIVCRVIAVARTALVVIRVFHLVPGLCYAYICVYICFGEIRSRRTDVAAKGSLRTWSSVVEVSAYRSAPELRNEVSYGG